MKQLIVLCSSIFLGIAIFYLIMGEQDSSVISVMAAMWEKGLEIRRFTE